MRIREDENHNPSKVTPSAIDRSFPARSGGDGSRESFPAVERKRLHEEMIKQEPTGQLNDPALANVKTNVTADDVSKERSRHPSHSFSNSKEIPMEEIIRPYPNLTSAAFLDLKFASGYQNQIMALSSFVLHCRERQILLQSLRHKDVGSGLCTHFVQLFDVRHWNPSTLPCRGWYLGIQYCTATWDANRPSSPTGPSESQKYSQQNHTPLDTTTIT